MRFGFIVLACLLGVFALGAHAQDEAPRDCKIFDGRQWQGLGTVSRTECLEGIEQWVREYNAQGFKFGLWGSMMLSADRNYFYRSPDGGKNWEALGLKSGTTKRVAEEPEPAAVAEAEVAAATQPTDSASAPEYNDSWATAAAPVAPEVASPTPAPTPTPTPRPVRVEPAPEQPTTSGLDRRSCSIGTSAAWDQVGILTLRECAEALSRSPASYDELGFKYGYWNGIFLAASQTEVLSSTDARSWQPLLTPRAWR